MPRFPRAVLPDVPHHLTQRGVNRQPVFFSDTDRRLYIDLVRESAGQSGVRLLGYCLMSNHAHWIATPADPDALGRAFGRAHCRYAHYANAVRNRSGHFWQNRFFSCALDRSRVWVALRYVEQNPVRAGLVDSAEQWEWSSAAAHTGLEPWPQWLDVEAWRVAFSADEWRLNLAAATLGEAEILLRSHTYAGRPFGSTAFVETAEAKLNRPLALKKSGRPRKRALAAPAAEACQGSLFESEWRAGDQ